MNWFIIFIQRITEKILSSRFGVALTDALRLKRSQPSRGSESQQPQPCIIPEVYQSKTKHDCAKLTFVSPFECKEYCLTKPFSVHRFCQYASSTRHIYGYDEITYQLMLPSCDEIINTAANDFTQYWCASCESAFQPYFEQKCKHFNFSPPQNWVDLHYETKKGLKRIIRIDPKSIVCLKDHIIAAVYPIINAHITLDVSRIINRQEVQLDTHMEESRRLFEHIRVLPQVERRILSYHQSRGTSSERYKSILNRLDAQAREEIKQRPLGFVRKYCQPLGDRKKNLKLFPESAARAHP